MLVASVKLLKFQLLISFTLKKLFSILLLIIYISTLEDIAKVYSKKSCKLKESENNKSTTNQVVKVTKTQVVLARKLASWCRQYRMDV